MSDEYITTQVGAAVIVSLPPAPVPEPPRRISVGAFKKRLGMDAMAIANSDDEVCVALREMLYDQPHVDLDGDVGMFLNMLIASQQPEARPRFPGSGPMTAEKADAILSAQIEDWERP